MKASYSFLIGFLLLVGCTASFEGEAEDVARPIDEVDQEAIEELTKEKASIQVISLLDEVTVDDVNVIKLCPAIIDDVEINDEYLVYWEVEGQDQNGVYVYKEANNILELGASSYDAGGGCIGF